LGRSATAKKKKKKKKKERKRKEKKMPNLEEERTLCCKYFAGEKYVSKNKWGTSIHAFMYVHILRKSLNLQDN
jgi:hypothetical protein